MLRAIHLVINTTFSIGLRIKFIVVKSKLYTMAKNNLKFISEINIVYLLIFLFFLTLNICQSLIMGDFQCSNINALYDGIIIECTK